MKYNSKNKRNTGLNRILGKDKVKQLGPIYKTTEPDIIVVNRKLVKLYSDMVVVTSGGIMYNFSLTNPNSKELLQSLLSDTKENFISLLIRGKSEVFDGLYQVFLKETVQVLLESDIFIYKNSSEFKTHFGFSIKFTQYNNTVAILDNTSVNYTSMITNFVVMSLNKERIASQINDFIVNEISKYKSN